MRLSVRTKFLAFLRKEYPTFTVSTGDVHPEKNNRWPRLI